jgi:hypothetical protein
MVSRKIFGIGLFYNQLLNIHSADYHRDFYCYFSFICSDFVIYTVTV